MLDFPFMLQGKTRNCFTSRLIVSGSAGLVLGLDLMARIRDPYQEKLSSFITNWLRGGLRLERVSVLAAGGLALGNGLSLTDGNGRWWTGERSRVQLRALILSEEWSTRKTSGLLLGLPLNLGTICFIPVSMAGSWLKDISIIAVWKEASEIPALRPVTANQYLEFVKLGLVE